jgi:hypothetical protein
MGPSGGSVELTGRQGIGVAVRLTVPPRAFDNDVEVTLVETSIPPPGDFSDWSPVYELLPAGVTTSSLMALRVPWGNKDGIVPPLNVYMAKDRNSPFLPLSDAYLNAGFSEASITEFGLFFVGVPKSAVGQTACP